MARKAPTPATINKLFALSGNTCAFPDCKEKLVDKDTVLGEVCHIEAANKGARYNPDTDDDTLRRSGNLILMCQKHHKIIDDNEKKYPTELLKKWKKEHEDKFSNFEYPISDEKIEKVVENIKNQYNTSQKSDKFNVNVNINYNETTNSIEQKENKEIEIDTYEVPDETFEIKLPKPKKPSKLFTGREDKLFELKNAFEKNNIISITGIGGFGKTELVLKFVSKFNQTEKEKITWQDFSESTNFDNFIVASGFQAIMQVNKLQKDKFIAFIDKINEKKRIIIWDNFHDNEDKIFYEFLEFAKGRLKNCKIVIISRTSNKISKFNFKNIELTDFKESFDYSKTLIENRYTKATLSEDEINEICKSVKGHPLAIELSLDLCQSMSAKRVIGKLSKHKQHGIDILSQRLFEEILSQDSTSQAEKDFLYQFSIFKERVSENAVETIFGEECFFETLPQLKNKYFIEFEQGQYDTHPLIREFCYQKLENKEELHAKVAKYFISKRTEKINILREERIFHHLKGADDINAIAETIEKYGRDYIRLAFYELLQEIITYLNKKYKITLFHDILIGDIYEKKGEWDKALKYFEKAKNYSTDEKLAVEGLLKYGDIYRQKGENEIALKIFIEAEEIAKENNFLKYIAWSYNNIAMIKADFGEMNDAYELYMKAFIISEKLNIKEDIATLYNNIGSIYKTKEFEKYNLNTALEYCEKSLKIYIQIKDKFHIANAYNSIGTIYNEKNNLNKALDYHKKSLKIKLKIGDKSGLAYSYANIGNTYYDLKQYEIAFENLLKSYAIRKQLQAKIDLKRVKDGIRFYRKELGKEEFLKYTNLTIKKLDVELQKEIELSEFLNEPRIVLKKYGRNDIVKVKYSDGTVKKGKYKKFIRNIELGKCKILEENEIIVEPKITLYNDTNNTETKGLSNINIWKIGTEWEKENIEYSMLDIFKKYNIVFAGKKNNFIGQLIKRNDLIAIIDGITIVSIGIFLGETKSISEFEEKDLEENKFTYENCGLAFKIVLFDLEQKDYFNYTEETFKEAHEPNKLNNLFNKYIKFSKNIFIDKQKTYAIKQFKINNFKGIKNIHIQNIPTDTQWIFLTGENGYGKTSVLQALTIGLCGNEDNGVPLDKSKKINSFIEIKDNEFNQIHTMRPTSDNFEKISVYGTARLNKSINPINNTKTFSLFNSYGELLDIENKMKIWEKDDNQKEYFENVKTVLLKLLKPYITNIEIKRVGTEETVLYTEKNNPQKITFHELAAGHRSIIAMVGDIILRLSKHQPDNIENLSGIVIIDEFDLHLHPKRQWELPYLLSEVFPDIQFIASTHSVIPILGTAKKPVCFEVTRNEKDGIQLKRWDNEIDIENLTPNLIFSSPLFDYQNIIPRYNKDKSKVGTEDAYDKRFRNQNIDEFIEKFDLDAYLKK